MLVFLTPAPWLRLDFKFSNEMSLKESFLAQPLLKLVGYMKLLMETDRAKEEQPEMLDSHLAQYLVARAFI